MGSINACNMLPSAWKQKGSKWAAQYAGSIVWGAGHFAPTQGAYSRHKDHPGNFVTSFKVAE